MAGDAQAPGAGREGMKFHDVESLKFPELQGFRGGHVPDGGGWHGTIWQEAEWQAGQAVSSPGVGHGRGEGRK